MPLKSELGHTKSFLFDRSHTNSYWRSTGMTLSSIVSETKRDIGRKSRFFHTLPTFDAPVQGPRRNFAMTFRMQEL